MTLRLYEDQIEVYAAGELVATLPRCHGKGQQIIQDEHYAGRHTGNKQSSLQQRFESLGPVARELKVSELTREERLALVDFHDPELSVKAQAESTLRVDIV